nr:hypothetical protein [Tanacetum cinerariifolium]
NTARDVLERYILPFVLGPYYIPYPYDKGSGSESHPYTKDDWEEIHGVNLGLRKKELYMDPKVCRTALDRFPTPAETHRLRELSSVELSDHMGMLQCQLITHGSMLNDLYDHSLRNVERLSKQCAQQTQTIKRQSANLKQQNTVHANEEVYRLTTELGVLKSRCQTAEHKLSSWDKKHRKYRNKRDTLAMEKLDFTPLVRRFLRSGEFNRAFTGVLNTTEKFDRVVAAFPDTTFLFLDKMSRLIWAWPTEPVWSSSTGTAFSYSPESIYYARKGELFVPLPSAAE